MKKLLIVLMVLAGFTFQLNAQTDADKIQDQLQEMTQEMQRLMTEFQGLMGNSLEMTDTLVQKGVMPLAENLKDFDQLATDSTDFNSLIDLMQLQMNELSQQDWGYLEKLMKDFGEKLPKPSKSKNSKRPKTDI
jgi:GH15 family glucan-1,4-alpha-glucosidase